MLVAQNSLGPVCPVPLTVRGSGKRKGPNDARVVTSLARSDWRTAWRVKRAKELLKAYDIVVGDLTRKVGNLSLLDYALNLSPALRDTITRDVAQNVSKYEPRLPRPFLGFKPDSSLREGSVQPKAAYLLQPPKAPE